MWLPTQIACLCVEIDVCLRPAWWASGGRPKEAHRRGDCHCGCAACLLHDCRAAHACWPWLHQCEAQPQLDQRADTQHAPPGKAATPWTHLRLPLITRCSMQTDQAPLPECPLYSSFEADDMSGDEAGQAALRRCSMHTILHLTILSLCRALAHGRRPSSTRGLWRTFPLQMWPKRCMSGICGQPSLGTPLPAAWSSAAWTRCASTMW